MRPRAPLRCRECGHGMHAKVSPLRHRFFAHDADAGCIGAGESIEHQELKRCCARWSREGGWQAVPEHAGPDWRADVLATAPDGRRIAWEIQVSPQHTDLALERTAKYHRDGIECVWLATGLQATDWFRPVGALVVRPRHPITGEPAWTVVEGCRKHHVLRGAFDSHSRWSDVEQPVGLEPVVRAILRGQLVPDPPRFFTGRGRPWWWVRTDERMVANELATRRAFAEKRQHRDLIDVRHRALREHAVTAALHRYPWLDRNLLNVFTGLENVQRNSVASGS